MVWCVGEGPTLKNDGNLADCASDSDCSKFRFFFINGYLCRSEGPDAAFRPSDVFVGRGPPPREALLLGDASPAIHHTSDSFVSSAVDSDCPIFNTFGVLSGGVLIDPCSLLFVDFMDDIIVAPSLAGDCNGKSGVHYDSLEYGKIEAEAVMCLCSSIEPFNRHGTFHTPLLWPRSFYLEPCMARTLAKRNINRILRRCSLNYSIDKKVLFLLETYRYHIKSTHPQSRFITEDIPFRFQYRGKALTQQSWGTDDDVNNDQNANYQGFSRSPFSEFHAYKGLPAMAHIKYGGDVRLNAAAAFGKRFETRVQMLIRPFHQNFFLEKRPRPTTKESECKQSWWLFLRYFDLFRVRPSATPNSAGRTEWFLEDDSKVNYQMAVREFENARSTGNGPRNNLPVVIDAWDWLLMNHRQPFLRRIAKVKQCLKKLHS